MKSPNVVILGAGAAGLMCAIQAGKRGRSVIVLERNPKVGEKIRISGGGRCNFTNTIVDRDRYSSRNPDFCRSALAQYTPADFIALVEKYGIPYHEKIHGQLFCDGSSREIIAMLEEECEKTGCEVVLECETSRVTKEKRFLVTTTKGLFESDSLVVATGGLSIPKLGATDLGYRVAKDFGLGITSTKPGLVPLVFGKEEIPFFSDLSGVSLNAIVSCSGTSFRENILFTHRGLSGPAILQISSYWNPGETISINLSPDVDIQEFLETKHHLTIKLPSVLSDILPKRLAQKWCEHYASAMPINRYSVKSLSAIARQLQEWRLMPAGTEGYAKAEVTCGGIDTNELSSKTMESKKVPGLFFVGEVVDVTGHLGGYNFQWAWSSGFAAGQNV